MYDVKAALSTFCTIRKAEGIAPKTIEGYKTTICPFLRDYPTFLQSPRSTVLDYVTAPENAWTRFTRIKTMKVFCKFLTEEGIITKDPLKGISNPMPRTKVVCPDMDTVQAFIKALDVHTYRERRLRCIILLIVDTGLRRGEICGLKVNDLDLDNMLLTVRAETSKSRRERIVPISPQVAREVHRFIMLCAKSWKTDYIFPSDTGEYLEPHNLAASARLISDRIGIKIKLHGLRHLCATEFLRETGNIALTAKLLGHTNISVTSRYYEHLDIKDLQEAHNVASPIRSILSNKRIRKI